MQEPLNKNEIIDKIARRIQCTACGRRYKAYDFAVVEERANLAVMRLTCRECHKQSIVLAVVQRRQVRPVFSELDPDEWQHFRRLPPLASDDVIRMHREMQAYDGDFTDVLEDPLPAGDE
ncbi:MAG: hypothetical protein WCF84_20385 [Anaerolineae bacterium]